MRSHRAFAIVLAVVALGAAAGMCSAQVPEQMNYQVMLTDAANQPLASQSVQLIFRIYDQLSGGSQLWTETQNVTTNSIGVVSVILGSVTPLTIDFSDPRWLEVRVNGEVMTPTRPLVAAPYALQADNSDNLGGEPAASWVLSDVLSIPGSLKVTAAPSTPRMGAQWTRST